MTQNTRIVPNQPDRVGSVDELVRVSAKDRVGPKRSLQSRTRLVRTSCARRQYVVIGVPREARDHEVLACRSEPLLARQQEVQLLRRLQPEAARHEPEDALAIEAELGDPLRRSVPLGTDVLPGRSVEAPQSAEPLRAGCTRPDDAVATAREAGDRSGEVHVVADPPVLHEAEWSFDRQSSPTEATNREFDPRAVTKGHPSRDALPCRARCRHAGRLRDEHAIRRRLGQSGGEPPRVAAACTLIASIDDFATPPIKTLVEAKVIPAEEARERADDSSCVSSSVRATFASGEMPPTDASSPSRLTTKVVRW